MDYTAVEDFTVTIGPGESSGTGTFMLMVIDDMLLEGNESITVTARLEGSIPDGFVTEIRILNLTITDNDALTGWS